jgi:hypothetical protein
MKTIYLDSEFKCHVADDGTMTSIETEFFDDKCDSFIEGYRLIPAGMSWTRSDGTTFIGEMVAPWKDYAILEAYQEQYERDQAEIEDMRTALNTMEVNVDG